MTSTTSANWIRKRTLWPGSLLLPETDVDITLGNTRATWVPTGRNIIHMGITKRKGNNAARLTLWIVNIRFILASQWPAYVSGHSHIVVVAIDLLPDPRIQIVKQIIICCPLDRETKVNEVWSGREWSSIVLLQLMCGNLIRWCAADSILIWASLVSSSSWLTMGLWRGWNLCWQGWGFYCRWIGAHQKLSFFVDDTFSASDLCISVYYSRELCRGEYWST